MTPREISDKLDHTLRAYARLERRSAEKGREIAALRQQLQGAVAENERLREGGKQLDGVIRRLVDENEELRAALGRLEGQ